MASLLTQLDAQGCGSWTSIVCRIRTAATMNTIKSTSKTSIIGVMFGSAENFAGLVMAASLESVRHDITMRGLVRRGGRMTWRFKAHYSLMNVSPTGGPNSRRTGSRRHSLPDAAETVVARIRSWWPDGTANF